MNNYELRTEIQKLKPWYQTIKFNDEVSAISSHSKLSGEPAWDYIKTLLPKSLEGKRVLDLGSNGGLFSIRASQMGAKEVIGIEREPKHLRQCAFVKKYFGTDNVKFINGSLENLPSMDIGKFDIVFAISVLYWVGRTGFVVKGTKYDKKYRDREFKFIQYLTSLSDYFVVRARGSEYNNVEYYSEQFSRCGVDLFKIINENKGTHEMLLFRRNYE